MFKEKQIAKYQDENYKIELVRLAKVELKNGINSMVIRYQVRMNRKRIQTSISEYTMRKLFAIYVQNIVLQLKIF